MIHSKEFGDNSELFKYVFQTYSHHSFKIRLKQTPFLNLMIWLVETEYDE